MKLSGQIDYHGSRAYAPDLPSATTGSRVRRYGGRLAAWARQKLELLLRPGAEQAAETLWLVQGTERHFSVLGSDLGKKPSRAAAPCSFPEGEARTRQQIGYRSVGE